MVRVKCDKCVWEGLKSSLAKHMRCKHASGGPPAFSCGLCSFTCFYQSGFDRHREYCDRVRGGGSGRGGDDDFDGDGGVDVDVDVDVDIDVDVEESRGGSTPSSSSSSMSDGGSDVMSSLGTKAPWGNAHNPQPGAPIEAVEGEEPLVVSRARKALGELLLTPKKKKKKLTLSDVMKEIHSLKDVIPLLLMTALQSKAAGSATLPQSGGEKALMGYSSEQHREVIVKFAKDAVASWFAIESSPRTLDTTFKPWKKIYAAQKVMFVQLPSLYQVWQRETPETVDNKSGKRKRKGKEAEADEDAILDMEQCAYYAYYNYASIQMLESNADGLWDLLTRLVNAEGKKSGQIWNELHESLLATIDVIQDREGMANCLRELATHQICQCIETLTLHYSADKEPSITSLQPKDILEFANLKSESKGFIVSESPMAPEINFKPAILAETKVLKNREAAAQMLPNIEEDLKRVKTESWFPFFFQYSIPKTSAGHYVICCLLQSKDSPWRYCFVLDSLAGKTWEKPLLSFLEEVKEEPGLIADS